MRSLLTYLLGTFFVLLFLVATTGVRMYSHYCSLSNTEYSSLFESLATCDDHSQPTKKVHSPSSHTCCPHDSQPIPPKPKADDCCDDDSQFYKISVDFNLPLDEQLKLSVKELPILAELCANEIGSQENDAVSKWLLELYHPPPKSGRTLIVFLAQLKTDPNPIA